MKIKHFGIKFEHSRAQKPGLPMLFTLVNEYPGKGKKGAIDTGSDNIYYVTLFY